MRYVSLDARFFLRQNRPGKQAGDKVVADFVVVFQIVVRVIE